MAKRSLFNQTHRRVYGEKAIEFSLLTIGGLVVAQIFSERGLVFQDFFLGAALFILGSLISYLFLKGVKGGDR